MKRLLPCAALAALLGAACTTGGPAGPPTAALPGARAASPAPTSPSGSGAPAGSPSPAPAKPSFKETARLDRELGNAVVPYPFNTCAVIQRPFDEGGPKHRRIYQGQEVLFCCTPCVRAFDANPDPYMPRIVAAAKDRAAGVVAPVPSAAVAR